MILIDARILSLIAPAVAPEWADFPKSDSPFRSDDPTGDFVDFYRAWIKCGNDPAKWNKTSAPAGWRDDYRYAVGLSW